MFHVQLRQFPNLSREFNISAEELRTRILRPWLAGEMVQSGDRKWAPERAKLTIYEGPELQPEDIGMGRGWQNVVRSGEEVTTRLLAGERPIPGGEGELAELKRRILEACGTRPLQLAASVRLAGQLAPGSRASEQLALAESAIWELLHEGAVRMSVQAGARPEPVEPVEPGDWRPLLLAWENWAGSGRPVLVEAV